MIAIDTCIAGEDSGASLRNSVPFQTIWGIAMDCAGAG